MFTQAWSLINERVQSLRSSVRNLPDNLLELYLFWPVLAFLVSFSINLWLMVKFASFPVILGSLVAWFVIFVGFSLIADFWGPKAAKIKEYRQEVTEVDDPDDKRNYRKSITGRKIFPDTCEGCDDELAEAADALGKEVENLLDVFSDDIDDTRKERRLDRLSDENNLGDKALSDYCREKLEEHFGIGRRKKPVGYWEFFTKDEIVNHLVDTRRLYPPEPDTNSPVERSQYLKATAGSFVVVSTLFLLFLALLTSLAGYSLYSPVGVIFWGITFIVLTQWVIREGTVEIDEGHKGVFKLLQTRYPVYSGEGLQYILPPFFNLSSVNTKVRSIDLEGISVPSQDENQVVFDIRIRFWTAFPFRFLGVDKPVEKLRDELKDVLRATASRNKLDFLTGNPLKITRDIAKSFGIEGSVVEENWGLQLLGIQVADVTPSEEMIEARERATIEEKLREGGKEKTEGFVEYLEVIREYLADKFDEDDLTPKEVIEAAQVLHDHGSLEVRSSNVNFDGNLEQVVPALKKIFGG